MTYRIERVGMETRGDGLAECLMDFVRRADPRRWDGYQAADLAIIIGRTARQELDASWIVFDENSHVVGFQILCFGCAIEQGQIEAQIVAFYLTPGTPLHVAPMMVEAMREYAREKKAKRIIGATQRNVGGAFRRLGALPVAIMYELPLCYEKEAQPRPYSYQS